MTCAALTLADSVAVDPHKWLYAPLEAGCALVRDPETLRAAFAYHPPYYHFDERATNYVDYGPQNSRGFRALKVWLALRQAGAAGYRAMIARRHPPVEGDGRGGRAGMPSWSSRTQALSITTFRYVPRDLRAQAGTSRRSKRISTRSTASCSTGCSAAARRSSPTPWSAAATCCAPAS